MSERKFLWLLPLYSVFFHNIIFILCLRLLPLLYLIPPLLTPSLTLRPTGQWSLKPPLKSSSFPSLTPSLSLLLFPISWLDQNKRPHCQKMKARLDQAGKGVLFFSFKESELCLVWLCNQWRRKYGFTRGVKNKTFLFEKLQKINLESRPGVLQCNCNSYVFVLYHSFLDLPSCQRLKHCLHWKHF